MDWEQFPFRTSRSASKAKEVFASLLFSSQKPQMFGYSQENIPLTEPCQFDFAKLRLSSFLSLVASHEVYTKNLFKRPDICCER